VVSKSRRSKCDRHPKKKRKKEKKTVVLLCVVSRVGVVSVTGTLIKKTKLSATDEQVVATLLEV